MNGTTACHGLHSRSLFVDRSLLYINLQPTPVANKSLQLLTNTVYSLPILPAVRSINHGWPKTPNFYASRTPSVHIEPWQCLRYTNWLAAPFVLQLECTLMRFLYKPRFAYGCCCQSIPNILRNSNKTQGWPCPPGRVPCHASLPIRDRKALYFSWQQLKSHQHFVDAASTPVPTSGRLAHGRGPRALRSSWQRRRCCSAPRTAWSVPRGTAIRGGAGWPAGART